MFSISSMLGLFFDKQLHKTFQLIIHNIISFVIHLWGIFQTIEHMFGQYKYPSDIRIRFCCIQSIRLCCRLLLQKSASRYLLSTQSSAFAYNIFKKNSFNNPISALFTTRFAFPASINSNKSIIQAFKCSSF